MLLWFLIHDGIHATIETTKVKRITTVGATIFWDLLSDETNDNNWDDAYTAFHSFVLCYVIFNALIMYSRSILKQHTQHMASIGHDGSHLLWSSTVVVGRN